MAEPGGTITGVVGGTAFNARVDDASFHTKWTSFMLGGVDTMSFPDNYFNIGITINRDLVGVGTFDCSVLGEAGIIVNVPVASGVTVANEVLQSNADYPCTITINSFGAVGEAITGSFSGTLLTSGGDGTASISGSINAIRGNVQ